MLNLSCLCGQVGIKLEERPDFIHECNCRMCSKTGARWGYFHPSQVTVQGQTGYYTRADKAEPSAEVHFCPSCGSTTHFVLTETAVSKFGNSIVGVNMWLAEPEALTGTELRYPDGRAWSGAGGFTYVRESHPIG
jgi:hypothetical protein